MAGNMTAFHISGRRWHDKVNGNTYHSAQIFADGELVVVCPFQYGNGYQWLYSAQEAMIEAGFLSGKQSEPYGLVQPLWQQIEESDHTLTSDVADVLKREVIAHGKVGAA